ncbi:MAG TPA: DUF1015 domain-containing protein [Terriglobales bacterium]|nr:DUF1015 domain-containing protein [Terriglobales bacterium]
MASIFPFRALRYDPERVRLGDVLTQPYDKITPAMQERYYQASPYNLVRIELGRALDSDNDHENVYTRAAASLAQFRGDGVLAQDPRPAMYACSQTFVVPTGPNAGHKQERRGFIALAQLEDYDRGVVFRHEQTLTAPKTDRLNLLRATRSQQGQLFMVYSDPRREVEALLFARADAGFPPDAEVRDEYGVEHRLWRVDDAGVIARAQQLMADKKLIIADGHHRYETALTYRNERREAYTAAAGAPPTSIASAPFERVMMTFVNMDAPGLVILPTHRLVLGLKNFSEQDLLSKASPYFSAEGVGSMEVGALLAKLAQAGAEDTAIAAATVRGSWILRAKPGAADALLAGLSPRQRALDVVQLHRILLEHVLGLSPDDIREQRYLRYVRDASEAAADARCCKGNVAFLINPVRIEQMRDLAFAGEVLPQKSTDFYPKLLSGLAIYALE